MVFQFQKGDSPRESATPAISAFAPSVERNKNARPVTKDLNICSDGYDFRRTFLNTYVESLFCVNLSDQGEGGIFSLSIRGRARHLSHLNRWLSKIKNFCSKC